MTRHRRPTDAVMERLQLYGSDQLSLHDVLLLLLAGTPARRVTVAQNLVAALEDGGHQGLGHAELAAAGLGPKEIGRFRAALQLVRRLDGYADRRQPVCDPEQAFALVAPRLVGRGRECFVVVVVDVRNRPIHITEIAAGSVDSCPVDPREVFVHPVRERGSAIFVAHNHPSGDPTPSPEDLRLTDRLSKAGATLGIPLLDHIIVGSWERYVSLAETGALDPAKAEPKGRGKPRPWRFGSS